MKEKLCLPHPKFGKFLSGRHSCGTAGSQGPGGNLQMQMHLRVDELDGFGWTISLVLLGFVSMETMVFSNEIWAVFL